MSSDFTKERMTLVEAFFHKQDQQLLNAFRDRLKKMDLRAQLAQVSGIHDEAILDRLIDLEIGPETLAAMAVVPLVFVAWADGKVQTQEREAILAAARDAGVQPRDGRYPMIEYWLNRRPEADLLEAWEHYIQGLCRRLDEPGKEKLKHDLLDLALKVGQAAGGILGLGNKLSAAEQALLDELEATFA
jgi:hypothetical protein